MSNKVSTYFMATAPWVLSAPILFIYLTISSRTYSGRFLFFKRYSISWRSSDLPPDLEKVGVFLGILTDLNMSCLTFSSRSITDLILSVLLAIWFVSNSILMSCLLCWSSFSFYPTVRSIYEQHLKINLFKLFYWSTNCFFISASWFLSRHS